MEHISNKIIWERVKSTEQCVRANFFVSLTHRAKIAGGWLIVVTWRGIGASLGFVADPAHKWTGDDMELHWELLEESLETLTINSLFRKITLRAAVPGGWILMMSLNDRPTSTFVPDPEHLWDGCSVEPGKTE